MRKKKALLISMILLVSFGYTGSSYDEYDISFSDVYGVEYDYGYEAGYEAGCDDGHINGYHEGRDEGYNEGYNDGYDEGYDEGYKDRTEEVAAEGEEEFNTLLGYVFVIGFLVLLVKFLKRYRKE